LQSVVAAECPHGYQANCVVDAREAEAIEMGELDQELDDLGAEFMDDDAW
jgi:hypothetical protein